MAFLITFIVACIFEFIGQNVFYTSSLGIIAAIAMACMFIVHAINGKKKSDDDTE